MGRVCGGRGCEGEGCGGEEGVRGRTREGEGGRECEGKGEGGKGRYKVMRRSGIRRRGKERESEERGKREVLRERGVKGRRREGEIHVRQLSGMSSNVTHNSHNYRFFSTCIFSNRYNVNTHSLASPKPLWRYRRLGLSSACASWDNSKNICAT